LAEELDLLLFAEAHFPEAVSDLGIGGKLFDPHSRPGAHLAQGAHERLAAFALATIRWMIAHQDWSLRQAEWGCKKGFAGASDCGLMAPTKTGYKIGPNFTKKPLRRGHELLF
jgi:hypothetical protein